MLNPLDDQTLIQSIDAKGMLGAIEAFPSQCADAVSIADAADLLGMDTGGIVGEITSVLTLGMGGSGIGGDVLKTIAEHDMPIPVIVNKGYFLPAFVGPKTLVIAVSYSGETEETLTTFEASIAAGARIIVITSGGTIGARAAELGLPVVKVPAGLQPRAALGYLSLPVIVVLRRLGLLAEGNGDIEESIDLLTVLSQKYGLNTAASDNPAKQLANDLLGYVPVIYGSEGLSQVAALRWKCQLNENSKVPAFWHYFPELNHNEIVGWQELADVSARFKAVILRDAGDNARVQARIEITVPLVKDNLGGVIEVESNGQSPLARLMALTYLGDFVSAYLGILYGVDPTPVERIQLLKKKLSEI